MTISIQPIGNGEISEIEIKVSNTCPDPRSEKNIFGSLNHEGKNVKPNNASSGTAMIKAMVIELLKGSFFFESKAISQGSTIHEFTITIKFPI